MNILETDNGGYLHEKCFCHYAEACDEKSHQCLQRQRVQVLTDAWGTGEGEESEPKFLDPFLARHQYASVCRYDIERLVELAWRLRRTAACRGQADGRLEECRGEMAGQTTGRKIFPVFEGKKENLPQKLKKIHFQKKAKMNKKGFTKLNYKNREFTKKSWICSFSHRFEKSRIKNRVLLEGIDQIEGVRCPRPFYEEYPDFIINADRERVFEGHQIIVWHFPFYTYSAPAL